MRGKTVAWLVTIATGLCLGASAASAKTAPKPPNPDPPVPQPTADLVAEAEKLLARAAVGDIAGMSPDDVDELATRLQPTRPDLAGQLRVLAAALRGQPVVVGPGDPRPAPGVMPADLAARYALLTNPNFSPTPAQVSALLEDLDRYQGFDAQKAILENLRRSVTRRRDPNRPAPEDVQVSYDAWRSALQAGAVDAIRSTYATYVAAFNAAFGRDPIGNEGPAPARA